MTARKPALGFIFITLLLDVLGFGLIIPVAPKLVQHLQGGGEQEAAGAVGFLAATYALMQFLFAPLLGVLSDRFGRRPVLLVSVFGSGLDYFAMALAPSVAWLFITRALNGVSGASMTAANAYIADVTPPEKRAAGFGMAGAAFGLGFVLGPLIGGFLGKIDIHYPFYAAGALTLCNWLYGFFVLPESLPPTRHHSINLKRANPIGAFSGLTKYPLVFGLAWSFFLMNLAQFALHATWVLYTAHKFGWGPEDVGLSLFAVGVGAAVVQAGLARRVIPLLGERLSLLIGVAIGVLSYVGYGAATHGWMIYATIALGSLGGIAMPAAQSIITRAAPRDQQGTVQGAMTGLQSVANVLGPLIGSAAFAYFISEKAPFQLPGAPFFAGAILAFLGLVIAYFVLRRHAPPPITVQADNDEPHPAEGDVGAPS
ncbi:MAG: TCR/Tet family MFS transporter [Phycisphaerae bacterium]|nr:TCR/Tet family MFS transporter [Phycisphaerae bacterium]